MDDSDREGSGGGASSPGPEEVYCTSCGELIEEEVEICPECGVRQKGDPPDTSSHTGAKLVLLLVIGAPVAIVITVILSAIVGTFVLGLGANVDTVDVQAGVNVNGEPAEDTVTATYVSKQNADSVIVTFEYDGGTAEAQMTDDGDRVRLGPSGLTAQGAATVTSRPLVPPTADAVVHVTVVARRGDESTVVLTERIPL